jgi:hypothetical protein
MLQAMKRRALAGKPLAWNYTLYVQIRDKAALAL